MIIAGNVPLKLGLAPAEYGIWDLEGKWRKQPFFVLRPSTKTEWKAWWKETSGLEGEPDPSATYFYLVSVD